MSDTPMDVRPGGAQLAGSREQIISILQRRVTARGTELLTPGQYSRCARWWELEALRGYPSTGRSRQYAAAQRWLAELAVEFGGGTPLDLLRRSGNKMP